MALGKYYARQDCSLARALEVAGERWSLLIVRDAFYGVRRFSDFSAHLDIPRAVLTSRLQMLVRTGVLEKDGHKYALTTIGRELWPAVHALTDWGERHFSELGPRRLLVHIPCGVHVKSDGFCPSCGRLIPPEELEIRPGPGIDMDLRDDAVTAALREPHPLLTPIEIW